ncbi:GDP-L-fucose synthase [Rhodobacteraceae bacterium HSP-20]|uniref:GDP-L-fucose synthase n=1 Tax=Paragemmobacter amnigenus TaxID=2852097 RepID=A0ABS6J5V1_9RHOB|nr:GDP-L-fucose synthase [Rhodobacter amnigenus]MBU9698234.1 GDP-L-fucose synthase [Rhodobacter amnigenus]MBV4389461.1 GDP-L-fucose synthase [Rhodobacter amnigenus]
MAGEKGRLLITGGSGMVGRNLREHPAIAGWQVLAPSSAELDLTDAAAVRRWLADHRPDAVIHAAGLVGGIQANMARPVDFLVINAAIGQSVILGAREAGITRFINLASTCMYPRGMDTPLSEDMVLTGELEPTNEGYAIAKILATRLCQYIRREDASLHYKTLIPCNLYGRHDKFDPAHSHLVPAVIHKVHQAKQAGSDSVEIWGDGTARREFLYAGDLADATLRALDRIDTLPDLMNVGLGHDHSINDYYAAAAEVVGWTGRFVHDLSRPVGMKRKLSDVSCLSAWGWQAPTSLRDGLRRTYDFYLERVAA